MLTFVMLLIGSKVQIFFEPETVWKDIFQHLSHPFATQYRLLLKCFLAARSKKYHSFFTRSAEFSCEIQMLHQYDSCWFFVFLPSTICDLTHIRYHFQVAKELKIQSGMIYSIIITSNYMLCPKHLKYASNIDFLQSKTMNENSMKYCGVKQKLREEILRTPI